MTLGSLVLLGFGAVSGAFPPAPRDTLWLDLSVPAVVSGLQLELTYDRRTLRFRVSGKESVVLPLVRERTGELVLELEVLTTTPLPLPKQWSRAIIPNGSRHVVWRIDGTGMDQVSQWPAFRLEATEVLEVLVGGRRVGTTPVVHGVAPGGPYELLWRRANGTTACVTDAEIAGEAVKTFRCDAATGAVTQGPPAPG